MKMEIDVWQQLDSYLRVLGEIERRTHDRQTAAVVLAELAQDVRAGLVRPIPPRVEKIELDEEEPAMVVKLPPRIPR
jgi:hypothetical protein